MTEEVAKVCEGKTWRRSHGQGTEKITWSRQGGDKVQDTQGRTVLEKLPHWEGNLGR